MFDYAKKLDGSFSFSASIQEVIKLSQLCL